MFFILHILLACGEYLVDHRLQSIVVDSVVVILRSLADERRLFRSVDPFCIQQEFVKLRFVEPLQAVLIDPSREYVE